MAFWGVEVKPGRPFTHKPDNARERLHISQATLGSGNGTKKSVVQCNVGEKSPVFLCSLFPDKAESCQLNLEFDEPDEVVFSVIGPRSVHLTGYYLCGSTRFKHDDDSESYGEDIADTETERSADDGDEDEDNYEDSFIDDDDQQLILPSPVSDAEDSLGSLEGRKPKNKKASSRRLRKMYQIHSDEDDTNADTCKEGLDGESEDKLTISSLCKSAGRNGKSETEENFRNETSQAANMDVEDGGNGSAVVEQKADAIVDSEVKKQTDPHDSILHSSELGLEDGAKAKKKKKMKSKKEKELKSGGEDESFSVMVLGGDMAEQSVAKVDQSSQNIDAENEKELIIDLKNEEDQRIGFDKQTDEHDSILHSSERVLENGAKAKKKKKKSKKERELKSGGEDESFSGMILGGDLAKENVAKVDQSSQNIDAKYEKDQSVDLKNEEDQRIGFDKQLDQHEFITHCAIVGSDDSSKDKKKKKNRSKEKKEHKAGTEDDSILESNQTQQHDTNVDKISEDASFKIVDDLMTKEKKELKSGKEDDSVIKLDQAQQSEAKADQSSQDIAAENEDEKTRNDKRVDKSPSSPARVELVCGIAAQSGQKRKCHRNEEKDVGAGSYFIRENKDELNEDNGESIEKHTLLKDEEIQRQANDESVLSVALASRFYVNQDIFPILQLSPELSLFSSTSFYERESYFVSFVWLFSLIRNILLQCQSQQPSGQMGVENYSRPKRKRKRPSEDKSTAER